MAKGLRRSLARSSFNLEIKSFSAGSPAVGATTAVMAAFTDNGKFHRFYNLASLFNPPVATQVTATFGGTAADIKAIQVVVIGTDAAGDPLTESLPAATVNTAGSVTSVGSFLTITSIEIPAHDGTGATTSIGVYGEGDDDILAAFTDIGVNAIFKTATITNPAVCRNITATAGGTSADVKAIQPIVYGTNKAGAAISETLTAFTVNTTGTVTGSKAFATITYIDLPVHDGTGATTAIGTGAKLGLPQKLSRNTVLRAFLANVLEATAPTVAVSATALESNTATLNSTLDGTAVIIDYYI
jgi:hypothetical protein